MQGVGADPAMHVILERLRAETRDLHRQTERLVPLMRPGVTVEDYRWFVQKMWGFHAALEPDLRRVLPAASWGCDKASLLADDARALVDGPTLQRPTQMPDLQTMDQALGALYVVEGATLGSQVIDQHLSRRLPDVMQKASRYLRCYGSQTRSAWARVCAALGAHAEGGGSPAAMVQSARDTFTALQTWLRA
jgi:heme oxygenase (biliverdin-IX-beta and delta-forming)